MKTTLLPLALVALLVAPLPALAAAKSQPMTIPDFTKGDTIPAGAKIFALMGRAFAEATLTLMKEQSGR